jgi:hypothetical protein
MSRFKLTPETLFRIQCEYRARKSRDGEVFMIPSEEDGEMYIEFVEPVRLQCCSLDLKKLLS